MQGKDNSEDGDVPAVLMIDEILKLSLDGRQRCKDCLMAFFTQLTQAPQPSMIYVITCFCSSSVHGCMLIGY